MHSQIWQNQGEIKGNRHQRLFFCDSWLANLPLLATRSSSAKSEGGISPNCPSWLTGSKRRMAEEAIVNGPGVEYLSSAPAGDGGVSIIHARRRVLKGYGLRSVRTPTVRVSIIHARRRVLKVWERKRATGQDSEFQSFMPDGGY